MTAPSGEAFEVTALRGMGRHAAWTVLQLGAGAVSQVAVAAVAVRSMGAGEFGEAALILAIGGLVGVADVGFGASLIRSVAQLSERDHASESVLQEELRLIQGLYVALTGVVVFVTTVGALVAAGVSDPFTDPATILLVGAGIAAFTVGAPVIAVATGLRDFRSIALSNAIGAALNVLTVTITASALGPASVGLGYFVGTAVQRGSLTLRVRRRAPWARFRPARPHWRSVRPVLRYSGPLVLAAALTQVVAATDLVVLSAFASAASVGLYRVGGSLPTWAVGALYRLFDVAFPALVRAPDAGEQLAMLRIVNRVACLAAGIGFGMLALERRVVIELIVGPVDPLASQVLGLFAVTWACNVPSHGLILLLTARGRHHILPFVVSGEVAVNVVLTVLLVAQMGPLGAVWATLATLAVSNLVVLPWAARHAVPQGWALVHRDGLLLVVSGGLVATLAVVVTGAAFDGTTQAIAAVALAAAVSPAAVLMSTSHSDRRALRSAFQRGEP